jgi:hypothetical protein
MALAVIAQMRFRIHGSLLPHQDAAGAGIFRADPKLGPSAGETGGLVDLLRAS